MSAMLNVPTISVDGGSYCSSSSSTVTFHRLSKTCIDHNKASVKSDEIDGELIVFELDKYG